MINDRRIGAYRELDEWDLVTLPSNIPDAKSKKSKYYYTGKPCKHGHMSPRYTSSRRCTSCQEVHSARCRTPVTIEEVKPKVSVFGISI